MADALATLELVWRPDMGSDVDVLDVLDWLRMPDGWNQASADGSGPVDEALTLNIAGSSADDLAAQIQDLDLKLKQIEWARNAIETNGVWLRTQLADETHVRQAYLFRGRRSPQVRVTSPAIWRNKLYQYQLGLTRAAWWEADTPQTFGAIAIATLGGNLDYEIAGDEPGRVAKMLLAATPGSTGQFNEVWAGAKNNRMGDPDDFVPVWDLTETLVLDTDTSESGGALVCTFGTDAGMHWRAKIGIKDVVADSAKWPAQMGRYQVLLRAHTTSSLIVNVRCGSGWISSSELTAGFHVGNHEEISTTTDKLYALGEFDLPVGYEGDGDIGLAGFQIEAEVVSGSGTLVFDRIVLIPALDGYLYAKSIESASSTSEIFGVMKIYHRPDGRARGNITIVSNGNRIDSFNPQFFEWGLPPGAGTIIFAAQDASNPASALNANLTVYERWRTLRGAA